MKTVPNRPNHVVESHHEPMEHARKLDVVNRLKSARGHIDHILALVEDDAYVLDLLRQVAAVRGALDATTRVALRHYFERIFTAQVRAGEIDPSGELMTALGFLRQIE